MGRLTQSRSTTGSARGGRISRQKADVGSVAGLTDLAQSAGLGAEVARATRPPKLSLLQRLSRGLGAFNPAEAVLTGIETGQKSGAGRGLVRGVGEYAKGIATGVGSAVTGRDYEPKRRFFSEVAEKLGVENGIAKFGIGFVGDVLLDPSTYFGGAIARGLTAGARVGGRGLLRGVGKVAPDVERGLTIAGKGVKDALGKGFVYGYGTSKGLPERALDFQTKAMKAKEGIVASNIARLGTGTLSRSQQEELVSKLLAGKRAEFGQRELSKDIAESADWFQPLKNRIERLLGTREKELSKLGTEINNLNKKGLNLALKGGKENVSSQRVSSIGIKVKPGRAAIRNFDQFDIPTSGEIEDVPDITKVFDASFVTTGSRETGELVRNMIKAPKKKLEHIKKLIGTREGWQKDLLEEITDLRNDFEGLARSQHDTLKLADIVYGQKGAIAKAAAESADPLVQKIIGEQAARSQKFAKQAGFADPFEVYFPGLKQDKLKKFFENAKILKVGSEGYRKQFKDLLTDQQMVRNPAEAFATREFEMVKDRLVRSELSKAIRDFGKPLAAFKNEEEAARAGYKLVKEKGLFGQHAGYLLEADKKFLDNLISPEFTTIDTLAKATGYDAVTSLFKRAVTGLFAPFHARNYASGHIQNFEVLGKDALNPKNIAMGQKLAWKLARNEKLPTGVINAGGKSIDLGKAFKAFSNRFGGSSSYISDIADATKGAGNLPGKILGKESFKTTLKTAGLGQQAIPFRVARAVGNFIETQQKATAFVTALGQGKTIEQALELATRAGFDYRALTGLESKILRRIIPFYSFARKNIELQLRTLGENPQRINQVIRLMENAQGGITQEEYDKLPDYAKEQFVVKTGETKAGLPEVAAGFGTPIEAFGTIFGVAKANRGAIADTIRRTAAMLNPIVKMPLERAFNKDFFRDRPLNEVVEATEYTKAPQFVKDFLGAKPVEKKNKDGTTRTVWNANPYRLQLLRALPTTRGATYLNAIFNDTSLSSKILSGLTGIKPRPIDLETVEYFRDRDKRRALEDLLVRFGVLKQFEQNYIPKD